MPEIVVALHELFERVSEIPVVPDCYLAGIWNDEIPEGTHDPEADAFPPVPWKAQEFDALRAAWDGESAEDWGYQWGWDGDPENNRVRVGCNMATVHHPIHLRFRWGEGHPTTDGVPMLIHEADRGGRYCRHCYAEMSGRPQDCPTRRLQALDDALKNGEDTALHIKAIKLWHRRGS